MAEVAIASLLRSRTCATSSLVNPRRCGWLAGRVSAHAQKATGPRRSAPCRYRRPSTCQRDAHQQYAETVTTRPEPSWMTSCGVPSNPRLVDCSTRCRQALAAGCRHRDITSQLPRLLPQRHRSPSHRRRWKAGQPAPCRSSFAPRATLVRLQRRLLEQQQRLRPLRRFSALAMTFPGGGCPAIAPTCRVRPEKMIPSRIQLHRHHS
mmetsp:Transcript_93958/g.281710  ORF Transcript_93958/g.281710 Transcript_93958/m.281710 type:complete len:207 (+) Transcript_93958:1588-2208(+)